MNKNPDIFTIGHSTRSLDEFIRLLNAFDVKHLVDVRAKPRSRRYPHFNRELLSESLGAVGINYTHLPDLGGFRKPLPDSPNIGWRNESFRGYADYMQTQPFLEALNLLLSIGKEERLAIMCAEAVPWRCHRSLIADALLVRGFDVEDIYSENKSQLHKLTDFAHVEGLQLTYPAGET